MAASMLHQLRDYITQSLKYLPSDILRKSLPIPEQEEWSKLKNQEACICAYLVYDEDITTEKLEKNGPWPQAINTHTHTHTHRHRHTHTHTEILQSSSN